ncbi:MAG: S9 family peptidase [bacterium]
MVCASQAQTVSLERIFTKPDIAGNRPSVAALSPDGSRLLFQWDSSARGENKLWMVPTSGGRPRQVLDSAASSCVWSPDGKRVAFTQKGDIFLSDPSFKQSVRLIRSPAGEGQLTWSHDSKLLSATTNNIFVYPVTTSGSSQLTNNSSDAVSYGVVEFSPDNKRILFAEYDRSGLPEFMVPQFTGTDVSARKFKSGFSRVRIGIAPVDTGKILWLKTSAERFLPGSIQFSPDGKQILVDQFDTTRKHRSLYVFDSDSGASRLVYSEFDSTWIEEGIYSAQWSKDGKSIYFLSERGGWNHLYQLRKDSSDLRQLTKGEWGVKWFDEDRSEGTIYFTANKEERGQWQLYKLGKNNDVKKISTQTGTYESPVVASEGNAIVCFYSDFDKPSELYSFVDGKERRLTNSISKEFQALQWIKPELVQLVARDGKTIHAMLYKPASLRSGDNRPCVVFVHGAGYLQNIFRGWSSYYYREYMFNNYLASKGYVVFELDYRGSAGYGRDFRRDVYMYLGGKDLNDELDGVEYLKKLGYIDSTSIGMYGGSYGGFLPLMALFKSPSTFAGAAVLRAVTSWENYYRHNPWYTGARLGTPDSNKEAYAKSSPITFADSLTKPLLILHGMLDDNVFFQDAAQLISKLQKAGKKFEVMMYPTEAHSFTQPENWYDEYRRIDEFFDAHLRNKTRQH